MKRFFACALLFCYTLGTTSCVPTAIATGAIATTSIAYDKRSISTILDDRHITQTASNLIRDDQSLRGKSHIDVATYNGIILLVGQAQTPELRQKAEQLIKDIPSVKRVYNEITVAGSTSNIQRSNDLWLTSKVKTAMITTPKLNSNQFKIVTENSVVYILGLTNKKQGQLASETARQVSGVTKVVTAFEYLPAKDTTTHATTT